MSFYGDGTDDTPAAEGLITMTAQYANVQMRRARTATSDGIYKASTSDKAYDIVQDDIILIDTQQPENQSGTVPYAFSSLNGYGADIVAKVKGNEQQQRAIMRSRLKPIGSAAIHYAYANRASGQGTSVAIHGTRRHFAYYGACVGDTLRAHYPTLAEVASARSLPNRFNRKRQGGRPLDVIVARAKPREPKDSAVEAREMMDMFIIDRNGWAAAMGGGGGGDSSAADDYEDWRSACSQMQASALTYGVLFAFVLRQQETTAGSAVALLFAALGTGAADATKRLSALALALDVGGIADATKTDTTMAAARESIAANKAAWTLTRTLFNATLFPSARPSVGGVRTEAAQTTFGYTKHANGAATFVGQGTDGTPNSSTAAGAIMQAQRDNLVDTIEAYDTAVSKSHEQDIGTCTRGAEPGGYLFAIPT